MKDRFDRHVEEGRKLIALHLDYTSLTTQGDRDDRENGFETAATDQIAAILHGFFGRNRPDDAVVADLLDRAQRCFDGDYEDMDEDETEDETEPVVVVVRDPDSSNEYTVFGGEVTTYDIDAGHMDLRNPTEYREWAEGHEQAAALYEREGRADVAEHIRSIVANYGPDA